VPIQEIKMQESTGQPIEETEDEQEGQHPVIPPAEELGEAVL
jgi:hypothetical protein